MQQTGTLAVAPAPPAPERLLSADEFMALPLNLKLYELVRGRAGEGTHDRLRAR